MMRDNHIKRCQYNPIADQDNACGKLKKKAVDLMILQNNKNN
jgi:hypothetical protein